LAARSQRPDARRTHPANAEGRPLDRWPQPVRVAQGQGDQAGGQEGQEEGREAGRRRRRRSGGSGRGGGPRGSGPRGRRGQEVIWKTRKKPKHEVGNRSTSCFFHAPWRVNQELLARPSSVRSSRVRWLLGSSFSRRVMTRSASSSSPMRISRRA